MTDLTGAAFVSQAEKYVGDPYVFGAAGPTTFDCSGLVQYSAEQIGLNNVPRTSEAQWSWVQKIQQNQLQPGDLIFEQWPGDDAPPGHVVIYAGNNQVIQAPQPGQFVNVSGWDPKGVEQAGGQIIGYGRMPGISGTGASTSGTTAASITDPSTWGPAILGSLVGALKPTFADIFERGALMVLGAILILVGLMRFTSGGEKLKEKVEEAAPIVAVAALWPGPFFSKEAVTELLLPGLSRCLVRSVLRRPLLIFSSCMTGRKAKVAEASSIL